MILSKSSNTKYKHELIKTEYICSQFPIDLEIQLSQAKFDQKTVLILTSVQELYQTPIAKYRGQLQSSLRGFVKFLGIASGEK